MKLWLKSLCFAFVVCVLYSMIPFHAECRDISEDTFRLHILANSDSETDQALKLQVRDAILTYTQAVLATASDKNSAEAEIRHALPQITEKARQTVKQNGFAYPVKAEVTRMYFDTRYYEDYTLPAGMYDALRISIGEAKGHNWWCVMYPSICVSVAEERDNRAREVYSDGEYHVVRDEPCQYKFRIVEWFERLQAFIQQASS